MWTIVCLHHSSDVVVQFILRNEKLNRKPRNRAIALPNEHGSWGIVFEPMVAAFAIAPSYAGICVCLIYIGAFLARQPLKIMLSDLLAGRDLPQSEIARRFLHLYGAVFLIGIAGTYLTGRLGAFYPALFVLPFAIFQIYCDVQRKSRNLFAELTGSVAISSSAAVIALAAGSRPASAFALWGILAGRLLPSILYVRNRLFLDKGKPFSRIPVLAAHFAALIYVAVLSNYALASKLTVAVFVVLLFRSAVGLSSHRTKMKAMKIGVWEVIYGVLTVLSIIIGYYLGI